MRLFSGSNSDTLIYSPPELLDGLFKVGLTKEAFADENGGDSGGVKCADIADGSNATFADESAIDRRQLAQSQRGFDLGFEGF